MFLQLCSETLNPLDQALTNVIKNLIGMSENSNEVAESIETGHQECAKVDEWMPSSCTAKDESSQVPLPTTNSPITAIFSIGPTSAANVTSTFVESTVKSENAGEVKCAKPINSTATAELPDSKSEAVGQEAEIASDCQSSSCSSSGTAGPAVLANNNAKANRSPEEVLAARADRLKRLEEQADWLMKKMSATSKRGTELSTRLGELHEAYGEAPPTPPPIPDVLPSQRLPTDLNTEPKKD